MDPTEVNDRPWCACPLGLEPGTILAAAPAYPHLPSVSSARGSYFARRCHCLLLLVRRPPWWTRGALVAPLQAASRQACQYERHRTSRMLWPAPHPIASYQLVEDTSALLPPFPRSLVDFPARSRERVSVSEAKPAPGHKQVGRRGSVSGDGSGQGFP